MFILESIVTTYNSDGTTHAAPLGVWADDAAHPVLAPFKPSRTLDNLVREKIAVINCTDDVRVFAGCVLRRHTPPLCPSDRLPVERLAGSLSHREVEVTGIEDDKLRPRLHCKVIHEQTHAPFRGFNRAQAAVVELAILVSRLDRLAPEKVRAEIEYLSIAVEKTASDVEREAWSWLMAKVAQHPRHQQHQAR